MNDASQRYPMQEFTNRIVAEREKGVKPWVRPWDPEKAGGPQAPFNPVTGKRCHGVNVLISRHGRARLPERRSSLDDVPTGSREALAGAERRRTDHHLLHQTLRGGG